MLCLPSVHPGGPAGNVSHVLTSMRHPLFFALLASQLVHGPRRRALAAGHLRSSGPVSARDLPGRDDCAVPRSPQGAIQ